MAKVGEPSPLATSDSRKVNCHTTVATKFLSFSQSQQDETVQSLANMENRPECKTDPDTTSERESTQARRAHT